MNKILKLKRIIKKLSEEQKALRFERKQSFKDKRKYSDSAGDAWWTHQCNRRELMHMFYLYDILRGKEPILPKRKEISKLKVEVIKQKHDI